MQGLKSENLKARKVNRKKRGEVEKEGNEWMGCGGEESIKDERMEGFSTLPDREAVHQFPRLLGERIRPQWHTGCQ